MKFLFFDRIICLVSDFFLNKNQPSQYYLFLLSTNISQLFKKYLIKI
jgi:hypothetical protein